MCAVEGPVDEAVLRRLTQASQCEIGQVYGKQGKHYLDQKIIGYNRAAYYTPWIVIRDMDKDSDCPATLRTALLPSPSSNMCFRIAVRQVEAWLLADRVGISEFLGVSKEVIPREPEELDDPKQTLINLARRSRRSKVREDIVPRQGSGIAVGRAYPSRIVEFVKGTWRPEVAAELSDSLRRCIERCDEIAG